jgi:lysophospholipase L1-like esterase
LTQQSFGKQGYWGSLLADKLQRVADVIPRGFSGYNTRWLKFMMADLFNSETLRDVSCLTIFLGANDCALPECKSGQHVPLEEFKDNLRFIVNHLECNGLNKNKILFLTPPPYYHDIFLPFCQQTKDFYPLRGDERPKIYGLASLEVANELGVEAVDVYAAFWADGRHRDLFEDGLHFSPLGAQLLFDTIWPSVEKRVLEHVGVHELAMNYPYWLDINKEDPSISLK